MRVSQRGMRRVLRFIGVGATVAVGATALPSPAAAAPTVVTLNFVDNLISHPQTVLPLLEQARVQGLVRRQQLPGPRSCDGAA